MLQWAQLYLVSGWLPNPLKCYCIMPLVCQIKSALLVPKAIKGSQQIVNVK
jgi:hypothetical protein